MRGEVIHNYIKSPVNRIAQPESFKYRHQVRHGFSLSYLSCETIFMNIIKSQKLFGAIVSIISSSESIRALFWCPDNPMNGSQFQWPTLIKTNYLTVFRGRCIEVEDSVFFTSNSGSGDSFHVFVLCGVKHSLRKRRLTHSSVMSGNIFLCLQYAANLLTDHWVKGNPNSSGRLRAIFINSVTCSDLTIGSLPLGLDGISKVSKPDPLNLCIQSYTMVKSHPTLSAISKGLYPDTASAIILYLSYILTGMVLSLSVSLRKSFSFCFNPLIFTRAILPPFKISWRHYNIISLAYQVAIALASKKPSLSN